MTARVITESNPGVIKIVWASIAKGQDGDPVKAPAFPDKSVIVVGSFDEARVTIQGRDEDGAWVTLHNTQGKDLEFTKNGIERILENPEEIRPSVNSAGIGTTDVRISIIGTQGRA